MNEVIHDGMFIPFRDRDLWDLFTEREEELKERIDRFTEEEILTKEEEGLADSLYEEYRFIPVEIQEEDESRRKLTRLNETYSIAAEIWIPFTGDEALFSCRGTEHFVFTLPAITLEDGYFGLYYEIPIVKGRETEAANELISQRDCDTRFIRMGIDSANRDIAAFNEGLHEKIQKMIRARKERADSMQKLSGLLGTEIRQKDQTSSILPVRKRTLPVPDRRHEREGTISDEDYEDILYRIRNIGATMEQSPNTYRYMKENDLRHVMLAQLNAAYPGQAKAEAFRKKGKTDISIERENRAAFVAECKIWNGKKGIGEAISQLNGYLTWRDSKAALICFVMNDDFFAVLSEAKKALESLDGMLHVKEIVKNEYDCWFRPQDIPDRTIRIRCFLFSM